MSIINSHQKRYWLVPTTISKKRKKYVCKNQKHLNIIMEKKPLWFLLAHQNNRYHGTALSSLYNVELGTLSEDTKVSFALQYKTRPMCVYIVFDFYGHILHPYETWETKIDIDLLHRVPSCIEDKTRSVFTPHISLLQIWLDYVCDNLLKKLLHYLRFSFSFIFKLPEIGKSSSRLVHG